MGSTGLAPPPYASLVMSFDKRNAEDGASILTVGARAWCKHAHRAMSGTWGLAQGSEATKNAAAREVLFKIIDRPCWINQHVLPVSMV